MEKNKGFTLIELLIVIAIIGLLSTLAYANLSSAQAKARDARRLADLRQVANALELYFSDKESYPVKYFNNTYYYISDNNYPGTGSFPPCDTTTGGLKGYLPNVCNYKDPKGSPYLYTANADDSPKLGAAFETAAYQTVPFTYGETTIYSVTGYYNFR